MRDRTYYEKRKDYFEDINFGESNEANNTAYFIRMTYEKKETTNDLDTDLKLLSNSVDYEGDYTEFKYEGKIIYYAKKEKILSGGKDKAYMFFWICKIR
jgi:hypothetical protein